MEYPQCYQLDQSISDLRIQKVPKIKTFATSDLVFHCFIMSHKKDSRLIWVNHVYYFQVVGQTANVAMLTVKITGW